MKAREPMDPTYLIFDHCRARYGFNVHAVKEIVWLPELAPIEELPPYIAGIFNLRGRMIPVMDLALRFGHSHTPFLTGDRVIVLERGEARMGVVANELHDVLTLPRAAFENARSGQQAGGHTRFVYGEAKLDDGIVMLLDVDALLQSAPSAAVLAASAPSGSAAGLSPWFGTLSARDAEIFRGRARSLAEVQTSAERSGLETFAVIRLDGELFGLKLDLVREFSHLGSVTPLPCCPPHIVGNMNLRGDIITLVDIRPALGMAIEGAMNEVVVVRIGELVLGLPATAIVDVVDVSPAEIAAVPVASDRAGKSYCKGVATVGGQAIGIIDLEKIFAARELRVAEQVQ
jgi:purine-binding chemotaxis protein CheW